MCTFPGRSFKTYMNHSFCYSTEAEQMRTPLLQSHLSCKATKFCGSLRCSSLAAPACCHPCCCSMVHAHADTYMNHSLCHRDEAAEQMCAFCNSSSICTNLCMHRRQLVKGTGPDLSFMRYVNHSFPSPPFFGLQNHSFCCRVEAAEKVTLRR